MSSLAALSFASPAQALSASATFDWSGFNLTVVDTAPDDGIIASTTLTSPFTLGLHCAAGVSCATLGDQATDWTSDGTRVLDAPGHTGETSWSAGLVGSSIHGLAPGGNVELAAIRQAGLVFNGASDVTLSVPFTLTVDDSGQDPLHGSFAMAYLGIGSSWSNYYISSPWDGTHTYAGVLTATLSGTDGTTTWFTALASSQLQYQPSFPPVAAPVPEPATVAMALGGLGLVGAAVRRRRVTANRAES